MKNDLLKGFYTQNPCATSRIEVVSEERKVPDSEKRRNKLVWKMKRRKVAWNIITVTLLMCSFVLLLSYGLVQLVTFLTPVIDSITSLCIAIIFVQLTAIFFVCCISWFPCDLSEPFFSVKHKGKTYY